MFSGPVSYVANTNIFARGATGGRQFLTYSMQYQADSELAMILPLPTPPSPPEDAVRFINLSGYPQFFDDMDKGFFKPLTRSSAVAAFAGQATLKVHDVGSFQASFVPSPREFARLDSRFRLPEQTWEKLPQYRDYAFAVFKLQAGAKNVHPMAFEFPRRNPQELFFPTVHVHDGTVEKYADFDHSLYFQTPRIQVNTQRSPEEFAHKRSAKPAKQFMDIARTQGLVDADAVVQVLMRVGVGLNRDIVINEEM